MDYSNKVIESLLQKFKLSLGTDYSKYKNHVYRVFLNCLLLDDEKSSEEKYAIAAVFHDIGIWTDHTIDYLNPSIEQAKTYLTETGKQDWIDEITGMINCHHKTSRYKGRYETTVENFRKADWIDVSLGILSFGLNKQKIRENRQTLPNLGFHLFLVKQITKNFFRHPLNPLPMFKK
ncbi:MAG: HD domain-containing protein [Chitinophagaceae bacterium]